MGQNTKPVIARMLRERQALLILDIKGKLQRVFALNGGKMIEITFTKNGRQKCRTVYLEDLTNLLT